MTNSAEPAPGAAGGVIERIDADVNFAGVLFHDFFPIPSASTRG